MASTTVSFQVTVEPELYQEIKWHSESRHMSPNRLLVEAVEFYLRAEKEREWREGFEAMGRDPEACDVEYMMPAARDVVLGV
jgi:hypothetical protein